MSDRTQESEALDANTRNWLVALHDDAPESSTTRVRSGRLLAALAAAEAQVQQLQEALRDTSRKFTLMEEDTRLLRGENEQLREALERIATTEADYAEEIARAALAASPTSEEGT